MVARALMRPLFDWSAKLRIPPKTGTPPFRPVGFDGAIKSMKIEIWSLDCSRHHEKNAREILQKACLETGGTFDSVAPGCRVAA